MNAPASLRSGTVEHHTAHNQGAPNEDEPERVKELMQLGARFRVTPLLA
jgi:hypothetical protein